MLDEFAWPLFDKFGLSKAAISAFPLALRVCSTIKLVP
jgi:hypothetical protein